MKKVILSVAMLLMISASANAKTLILKGDAADSFIGRHFPDASIPGPVSGAFTYINKMGKQSRGFAQCSVPAMGGRSDGEVSECSVRF